MTFQVLITEPDIWRFRDVLTSASPPDVRWTFVEPADKECVLAELPNADAYVGLRFDEAMGFAATRLRLLQATSTGTEHLRLGTLRPGVSVCNVHGHERSIAEFVAMATVALHRQTMARDAALRSGRWMSPLFGLSSPPMHNVEGRLVGVVGFGHIGREVGQLAAALGMRVRAITRSPGNHRPPDWLSQLDPLDALIELFAASDVVVLAVPLTDALEGFVGAAELAALGPDGYLINVGRGELVQELALYEALRTGTIAGAALDVWYRYPENRADVMPSVYPFHELDNVLMSPHVSGAAEETFQTRARLIAENICRLVAGETPRNRVMTT